MGKNRRLAGIKVPRREEWGRDGSKNKNRDGDGNLKRQVGNQGPERSWEVRSHRASVKVKADTRGRDKVFRLGSQGPDSDAVTRYREKST